MKLESLKSPVFEALPASQMVKIVAGTTTSGYRVNLPGQNEFVCASDCTEIDGNGDYYAEFYDAQGKIITTFLHKN